jgi:sialate O-acetylesterase
MRSKTKLWVSLLVVLFLSVLRTMADVKLPAVISDNMVLQQKIEVAVWGWADPGERIEVQGDWQWIQKEKTVADENGRWQVKLKTPSAGGPHTVTVQGNNRIVIQNVLIGEVWLGSGQSNMEMRMSSTDNAKEEIAAANFPRVRLFTVPRTTASEPVNNCTGVWVECSADIVPGFSAVAYYFAKKIHGELNVPVGMIHSSWGGTPAEAWTPEKNLATEPEFEPILKTWKQEIADYPVKKVEYDKALKEYTEMQQRGEKPLRKPTPPRGPDNPRCPSVLYNGMIHPLIPYTLKGAIWYQGESNAGRAYQYRKLFPAMITSWRNQWGQGDFPFYFVQLANYQKIKPEPAEDSWAELREAQAMTIALPRTGMAVAIDIGDEKTIHPLNKKDVGERLARWALAKDYGREVIFCGPVYKSMKTEDGKIILTFDHTDGGLIAGNNAPLKQFAIAGADKKFVWADAEIAGDTVVVKNQQVPDPVAVRYAWQTNPQGCNLYNKAGLPASPFRTDDWPGVTAGKDNP